MSPTRRPHTRPDTIVTRRLIRQLLRADTDNRALRATNAELLAALKHAVAVDAKWRRENGVSDGIRPPEYQESYDMVLAAIAHAEGRS